jgi:CheY-like chemotaxis protein
MDEKVNILLVDDKPEKLLSLEAVLEDLGQNIVRAYNGREALRSLLAQEFAVILLDVNMPGMDGFETASLIRQRKSTQDVPIIFVTAYGDDDHRSGRSITFKRPSCRRCSKPKLPYSSIFSAKPSR